MRKSYQVVINGVTGTLAGSRPWSWIKIALLVLVALFVLYLVQPLTCGGLGSRRVRDRVASDVRSSSFDVASVRRRSSERPQCRDQDIQAIHPHGDRARLAQVLSSLRPRRDLLGLGASSRSLLALWPGLRAQPR